MIVGFIATKLVVRDADAAERFYAGLGLTVRSRNVGGEGEVRQKQAWLGVGDDSASHALILSEFLEVPAPSLPAYPRELWLAFRVADVDAALAAAEALGGRILRAGQDRPEHRVRAAVIADPEGHVIEIVGPMPGAQA